MKKIISSLTFIFITMSAAFNVFAAGPRVIETDNFNYEYLDHMYKISHILRVNDANLLTTAENLPRNTEEAHDLFEEVCSIKSARPNLNRKLVISQSGFLTTFDFQCQVKEKDSLEVSTVQFVVVTDRDESLKDLQVNRLSTYSTSSTIDSRVITPTVAKEMGISIAASTLISGILARQMYDGAGDKITHGMSGSLIGAIGTLLAYYKYDMSKNKAALIGFAAAVAVGLLDEYGYKPANGDVRDARATIIGGAIGTMFIRWNMKF